MMTAHDHEFKDPWKDFKEPPMLVARDEADQVDVETTEALNALPSVRFREVKSPPPTGRSHTP